MNSGEISTEILFYSYVFLYVPIEVLYIPIEILYNISLLKSYTRQNSHHLKKVITFSPTPQKGLNEDINKAKTI